MRGRRTEAEQREEFAKVALPHLDRVYSTAVYLSRDPSVAEDLTQETFLRAYRFFHQYESGTNCAAWLLTILHNTFRNHYRARKRDRATVDVDEPAVAHEVASVEDGAGDPESLAVRESLDSEVDTALRDLPEEFRSVIVLVDLRSLTYEEAARALDCPIGTVRSRLSRGRRLLAKRLADYAREHGFDG